MTLDPLERVRIGGTDVSVTRLGLGLAPIGGLFTAVSDQQAHDTVRRGWDLGLRYFDVAPLYGNGLAETRAGAVLAGKPQAEFTLSTKVGRLLRPGGDGDQEFWAEPAALAPVFDYSADGIRTSYAESLARLGLSRTGLLHLHDPDDHFDQAAGEALPAMTTLRDEGRIGAVSAGMNQAPMLADFVRTGHLDAVLLAGRFTLLDRSGADELLPLCREKGVSVIAGGVFNSGLLADPRPGAMFDYAPADAHLVERALEIRDVCGHHGVPLRAAAIQFPLTHPAVTSVLVGVRSPAEVDDAVAMASVPIPAALWQDLGINPLEYS
ncbi:aldo/keto reductase [Actinoplanes couchii]|uniref:Oxidoreductase n=1 Tax=Actinoplanes couchii TaxID=403638 RepID=A0ABQ3X8R3_9ACTN|nr:aldo/keto reductase [Actinoplanes couchii]MDR6320173.1 D-threo-aldose 1-dehydrogenase [Actinoplanes couchii]GID54813.1 oxidoreductase [Actinoplanes couchii]